MDLIKAEVLGLTAHTALSVTLADWCIAANKSDLDEWQIEATTRNAQPSEDYLLLVQAARTGGADHPQSLFSPYGCVLLSTSDSHWLCVGWAGKRPDQIELSAGQKRVVESLEQCLSPCSNWHSRLVQAQDRVGRGFLIRSWDQAAVLDTDGVLIAISIPLANRFGWPEKSLIHRPLPLIWPGGAGRRGALLSAASRGGDVNTEITLVRKLGDPIQVQANLHGLGDPDYPRILLTVQR